MKELFLLRGLPGSGKSTLAKSIGGIHIEADMYFMKYGEYQFDVTLLRDAHSWCQNSVETVMKGWGNVLPANKIVVSNTFTQEWEMQPYLDMAKENGYTVFTVVVENRHGGKNVHNVPEDKIQMMKDRFQINL